MPSFSNTQCDFEATSPTPVPVNFNQWRNPATDICPGSNVIRDPALDIDADNVDILLDTTQPVFPSNIVVKGQTIRIKSSNGGFNAIRANPTAAEAACTTGSSPATSCCYRKNKSNTCSGVHMALAGNCVEIVDALGNVKPLQVTSVTPTMIVAEIPGHETAFTRVPLCHGDQQEKVWVSKTNSLGQPISKEADFCKNM
jgi:hypothetical protein